MDLLTLLVAVLLVAGIVTVIVVVATRRGRVAREQAMLTAPALAGPTNPLAIAGFISVFFTALGGIVFGHIALSQIKRSGEGGHGLALAAVIIGWTLTGIGVLALGIPLLIGMASGTIP